MSDNAVDHRFRSSEFAIQYNLLQYPMYRPLLDGTRLPLHARLCIGLGVAALLLPLTLAAGAIAFGYDRFHGIATDVNMLAFIAFIMGVHLDASRAATSFGRDPVMLLATLIDRLRLLLRKQAFEQRCEHIGRALDLRSDYLPQRVKIWLGYLIKTHAFASHSTFVRMLAARSTQARLCEMELAEKLEAAIENGATDPASALRIALQGCHWMDPQGIEQAAQADVPAVA